MRSAPKPSGPSPARTRLFSNRLSVCPFPPGTRACSCAPLKTVIVFAAFRPKTGIEAVELPTALCASRMPSLMSTVPTHALLLSFETMAVPAPSLTTFVMGDASCV